MPYARRQRGSSLIETLIAVGILGLIAYFVVGMLKTGTVGQKTLQTQDDARTITDNIVTLLGSQVACENTFGLVTPQINPLAATEVQSIKDPNQHVVYAKGGIYGNKTLKLESITVGGPDTDAKSGHVKWVPSGTGGGTAFVELTFSPAGVAAGDSSAPAKITRYFLLNVTAMNSVGLPPINTIKSCTALGGTGGASYWSLNSAGNIYNNNMSPATSAPGGIGVGTSSPIGLFDVYASSQHALMVSTETASPGFVGVGTSSPSSPLTVSGHDRGNAWSQADFQIGDSTTHLNVGLDKTTSNGDVRLYSSGTSTAGGRLIFGTGTARNDVLYVEKSKVGILTDITKPLSYPLEVNGDVQATSFISTSDARLKTDVRPAGGLEKVLQLRGVVFTWIKDRAPGMGLIAQEVEKVFPAIVATDKASGLKAVRYEALTAPLVEAVKELYGMGRQALGRIAALEASSAAKDRMIEELSRRLEQQERELAALRMKLGQP